jgi:flagellar basal body-associated protein FliL
LKPGKRIKTVLIIVIIVAAAVLIGIAAYVGRLYSKINKVTASEPQVRIPRSEETFEVNTDEPDTIEVEEVEELFDVDSIDMMDADEDGYVSFGEVRDLLKEYGEKLKRSMRFAKKH